MNMDEPKLCKRNTGIDFLRILAMFYVVMLHTLGHGGILGSLSAQNQSYNIVWFLEIWAYSAVDIFALISGFVGYREEEKPIKYSSYILLWVQAIFYGVVSALIVLFLHREDFRA